MGTAELGNIRTSQECDVVILAAIMVPGIAGVTTNRVLCTITTAITTRPKRRPCEIVNLAFASHDEFLKDKCVLNSFCDQFWWEFVIFKKL